MLCVRQRQRLYKDSLVLHHHTMPVCFVPAKVFTGGGPLCWTWVIILAAPPAAAITYVNESSGLEPSVYGGGASSSSALFEDSPLVSAGSAALVSASATVALPVTVGPSGGAGQKAGGGSLSGSVTDALNRSGECAGGK